MPSSVIRGLVWFAVFILSTTCHEAAHAWAAARLGDDTAARGGQRSLNPWPHIRREPIGMVVVPLLSWFSLGWMIGWASAPYNVAWARAWPRRAALMALAGPLANLGLALAAALAIRVGLEWQFFTAPAALGAASLTAAVTPGATGELLATLLSVTLALNLLLCIFNLVPLPPLDGSAALVLALPSAWAAQYTAALRAPALRYIGLFAASRLLSPLFPSLLLLAARALYPEINYA